MVVVPTISHDECASSYPELLASVAAIAPNLTDEQHAELVSLAVQVCRECYRHEASDCECWRDWTELETEK